jgi:ribosomal protein S18 acetylase RimI-like enzyme
VAQFPRAIRYRPATREDEPLLWTMLYQAIHVPSGAEPPPEDVVRRPELARYVEGWSDDDLGLIAIWHGERVGAAWLRLLTGEHRGYGHVADDVPELAVAVLPQWRGRGVGSALLRRLLASARERHTRVSLSVNAANPARRLYERLGFRNVEMRGDAVAMVLDLERARLVHADLTWHDLRDARIENQLAKELREISEEEAFERVKMLTHIDAKVGLSLARRVLKRRAYFESLLRDGLQGANESTIRAWIDSSARCLGAARVVEIVSERLEHDPLVVDNAVYWLRAHVRREDAAGASLRTLQRELNVRLPNRARPVDPD